MPAPVPHHHASGIHPGAFVQDTEPSTADVQDGVLWIDTSTGPPHQLKRWHAEASAWHPIQMDATGYPLPLGNRVEERIVPGSSIPDPTEAPSVEVETVVSGLPAGTYPFVYTFVDADGHETLPSPITAVTSTSPAFFAIFRPTLPDGVYDINVYLLAPSPSLDIATGFVVNFGGGGTIPPYAITGTTPESFPGTPQPPETNTTGRFAVVVVDPLGDVGLQVPLDTLTVPTPLLAGQDPTSGVLAFCPHPANLALPPNPPAPVTVPSGQDVQARCGASSALTGHLTSLYSRWSSELGVVTSVVGTVALTAFLINLVDPLYDVALVGASGASIYQVMRSLIAGLVSAGSGTLFDSLTTDETSIIQKACFCALTTSAGTVPITQIAIDSWRSGLPGDLGLPGTLTNQLLDAILAYTPLIDWQTVAQGAGTSSACDTWTCP